MVKLSPKITALVAATAAAGLSGAAISGAAGTSSSSTSPAASTAKRSSETALTGDTKSKVEAAALAKVKGTIVRTETDDGGVYESHIRKADGTEVEVKVNKDFAVTAVETAPARGRGGRGGHGGPGGPGGPGGHHADVAAIAKALGVTEAKLTAALEAARPDKGTKDEHPAAEAAAIAKSLGESTADVKAVLDATHGGGRHGRGDDTALVAALVKKFSVSEAKAQAAVDAAEKAEHADHATRETAMYAAVAKALGKDAAAVKKAFEANRPAKPTP